MKEFSIAMALVDYLPVACFLLASVLLLKDCYPNAGKTAYALLSAGLISIVCAGTLKATYKLLYAANICDFAALSDMFFPVQSIGFLLSGIGMLLFLFQTKKRMLSVAPPLYAGTFLFVGAMVLGLAFLDAGLCILSVRRKKYGLIALFVLSFLCSLGMGYLSSQDFTQASMNWIAEGINVVGQGTLLLGVLLLRRTNPTQEAV